MNFNTYCTTTFKMMPKLTRWIDDCLRSIFASLLSREQFHDRRGGGLINSLNTDKTKTTPH